LPYFWSKASLQIIGAFSLNVEKTVLSFLSFAKALEKEGVPFHRANYRLEKERTKGVFIVCDFKEWQTQQRVA
jgi:hypothetical protein